MINREVSLRRPQDKEERRLDKHMYYIYGDGMRVGELTAKKENGFLIISFIGIYDEYQRDGYGTSTIRYLFDNYSIDGIVGEIVDRVGSISFWDKMVEMFNGIRYSVVHYNNTIGSFVLRRNRDVMAPNDSFVSNCLKMSCRI